MANGSWIEVDWDRVAKAAAALAAIVVPYAYGVSYFSLTRYYDFFGLAPEDAGVTQGPLVARALTCFSLLWAPIVLFVISLAWSQSVFSAAAAPHPALWWARWVVVPVLLGTSVVIWLSLPAVVVLVAAPTAFGAAVGILSTEKPRAETAEAFEGRHQRTMLFAAFVTVALAFVFAAQVVTAAERLRVTMLRDGDVDGGSLEDLVAIAFGITAQPVRSNGAGVACGRAVARDGDAVWVAEPTAAAFTVRRIEATEVTFDNSAGARSCWPRR